MFELLLYSQMACVDAVDVIDRINKHEHMEAAVRAELIEVVQEAMCQSVHGTQTTKGTKIQLL